MLVDKEDENGVKTSSTKSKIEILHKGTEDELKALKQKSISISGEFAELKKKLETRIDSLLPGAGAAGLSYAYFDAKGRYGATPFKAIDSEKANWFIRLFARVAHYVRNYASSAFYYALFILPLVFISDLFVSFYIGKSFLIDMPIAASASSQTSAVKDFFYRILVTVPMGLISWFGYATIRQNRRLYAEYDYKQRVMELYHSFKAEIDNEGTEDQKQRLLEIMLQTVAFKPSLKTDKLPIESLIQAITPKKTSESD